jgi:hypothetical protein
MNVKVIGRWVLEALVNYFVVILIPSILASGWIIQRFWPWFRQRSGWFVAIVLALGWLLHWFFALRKREGWKLEERRGLPRSGYEWVDLPGENCEDIHWGVSSQRVARVGKDGKFTMDVKPESLVSLIAITNPFCSGPSCLHELLVKTKKYEVKFECPKDDCAFNRTKQKKQFKKSYDELRAAVERQVQGRYRSKFQDKAEYEKHLKTITHILRDPRERLIA